MRENGVSLPAEAIDHAGDVSTVIVARDGQLLGVIELADQLRSEASRAVERLHGLGIQTLLLTGDTTAVAGAVAKKLGIKEYAAGLLPEAKVARMRDLVARGRIVAMVGDGINDAPALTAASVGVAMGCGTDVARESADIVLLGNDLARFVDTVTIARRTRDIIWFNFIGTIAVDVIGVALIFMGYVGPLLAAVIHTASEFAFILNSARLLPHTNLLTSNRLPKPASSIPPLASTAPDRI
jgi:Cd2+/Zn2+-exporting ATPase/Cu+-exporting ATPase